MVSVIWWSWGKWTDPVVDFGRELYTAWRLSEGQWSCLYFTSAREGPLAPLVNALWFRLFGVSLRTLVLCNLMLLAVLVWMLYRILAAVSSRRAATAACMIFLTLFAFSQFGPTSTYNYVCPYAQELVHGLVLAVAALNAWWTYLQGRRLRQAAVAGVCLGLTFLAKPETCVAAAAALTVGCVVAWRLRHPPRPLLANGVAVLLAAALAVPLAAGAWLSLVLPSGQAWRVTMGSWPWLLHPQLVSMPFYQWCVGTDDVAGHLARLVAWSAWMTAAAGLVTLAALRVRWAGWRRWAAAAAIFLGVAVGVGWAQARWHAHVIDAFCFLPVVMALLVAMTGWSVWCRHHDTTVAASLTLRLMLIVFAGALLGKIALNARIYHYGFVLAMPATLLLVVALVDWWPRAVTRHGGTGTLVVAVALGVWVAVVQDHAQLTQFWFRQKTHRVGHGADVFWADARGGALQAAADYLAHQTPPEATVMALPEGLMLNYLARRVNPTPYPHFTPFDTVLVEETRMLQALQAHPPDYLAVLDRETGEYGPRFFGRDYAQHIVEWIRQHYQPVRLFGAPPLEGRGFGILLLRRAQ